MGVNDGQLPHLAHIISSRNSGTPTLRRLGNFLIRDIFVLKQKNEHVSPAPTTEIVHSDLGEVVHFGYPVVEQSLVELAREKTRHVWHRKHHILSMPLQGRILVKHTAISEELAPFANLKQHEVHIGQITAHKESFAEWLLEVIDNSFDRLNQVVPDLLLRQIAKVTGQGRLFKQLCENSCKHFDRALVFRRLA